jgi:DNA-binding transcriptional ArsR family regulator
MAPKTKRQRLTTDERLYKALSHPLRQKILVKLNERPASPSDLAVELDEKVGNVAYHVRALLDLNTIELVRTEPVRGTLEHFYCATARPFIDDEHWARLPVSVRRQFTDTTVQGLWEHVVEATDRGGFDDPRSHVSWTTLHLDEEGRDEVARILNVALEDVLAEQAEAAGRLAERSESEREDEVERTEVAILHYLRPDLPKD